MSESQGLKYLMKNRPEAMKHYLKFLGSAGANLDEKTRMLLTVVIEVVNFSPRGLRHYIPRAIAAGATVDEVVDTILYTYPMSSLVKVVDAIDIMLAMDLEAEVEKIKERKARKLHSPEHERGHGHGG